MTEYEIKDSGTRRTFDTGSVRDSATGKGRYDLISPIALRRLALHYEGGAIKYEDRNWEKGQPLCGFLDCGIRHLQKFLAGYREEDHLAAAAWNIFAAIHIEDQIKRGALPAELNDLPDFVSPLPAAPVEPVEARGLKVGSRVVINDTCGCRWQVGDVGTLVSFGPTPNEAKVVFQGAHGSGSRFFLTSLDLLPEDES